MLGHSYARGLFIASILLAIAQSAQSAVPTPNQPRDVCSYLERAANRHSLGQVTLRGSRALFVPEDMEGYDLVFRDQFDINNDGVREYVYVVQSPAEDPTVPKVIEDPPQDPQRISIYDQTRSELQIEQADEPTRTLPRDADAYRFLLYRKSYYVVALKGGELLFAYQIDRSNVAQPVCVFDQRASGGRMAAHALTTYEWLDRSADDWVGDHDDKDTVLWHYALTLDHLGVAELLVANGHSINEKIDDVTLLEWAIDEKREDIVDWLLEHGADPGVCVAHRDVPLSVAVRDGNVPIALKLMRHGADVEEVIDDVADLHRNHPEPGRPLMLAAIASLGFIPERFLSVALREDPALLDEFVKSGAPVRPYGPSWHAGERMKLPFDIDSHLQQQSDDREKVAVARLFERETIPPADSFAIAHYGSYTQGVQFVRYNLSHITNDDFLSFATAFCYYFLQLDCGSEELVGRARDWAGALKKECPARLGTVLEEPACRLAAYYRDADRVSVFRISPNEKYSTIINWQECIETYRRKHAQ